jgi:hypothetical protein
MGQKGEPAKFYEELPREEVKKNVEPLMGLAEFGQTAKVNAVLLAGYQRHCELTNAPKRRTRTEWQAGLDAWGAQAAG